MTFRPPVTETGFSAANVGFVVYHKGIHVNNFRYLGSQETLNLDWEDPWYSEFEKVATPFGANPPNQCSTPISFSRDAVLRHTSEGTRYRRVRQDYHPYTQVT